MIGIKIETSLSEKRTASLWQSFMPRRKEIDDLIDGVYYSIQCYPSNTDFDSFGPATVFEKWAAVEVSKIKTIPPGMSSLVIPSGLYAVFTYRGLTSEFAEILNYIFGQWLPQSKYSFDNRPQFEIMDDKYLGPENQDSEETVWIPLKTS